MGILVSVVVVLLLGVALWSYFGFVYFDLDELEPASKARRAWSVFVALALPAFAIWAGSGISDKTRLVLSGVGLTTILGPAIVPEAQRKSSSLGEWFYVRTAGQWFADLVETGVVYGVALLGAAFGSAWVGVYFGAAMTLAIGRSLWVRLQPGVTPRVAKPALPWILIVFSIIAVWAWFIVDAAKLKSTDWNTEFSALYKPHIESILLAWTLRRWPWLIAFRPSANRS